MSDSTKDTDKEDLENEELDTLGDDFVPLEDLIYAPLEVILVKM